MTRKNYFYIAFFAVLVLVFYFVLARIIPGFSEKKSPPISYVRSFSFLNQNGKRITDKDMEGKVYVVEYFFTTCKGICPRMNNNMKLVFDALKDEPDFYILSHTCDPETDSVGQLRKYSDSLGVDTKKWIFLTGRKDSLYSMARTSYAIDNPKNIVVNIDDDFLHTQFWALVDRNGYVRKIYDGLRTSEVKELIKDAKKYLRKKTGDE